MAKYTLPRAEAVGTLGLRLANGVLYQMPLAGVLLDTEHSSTTHCFDFSVDLSA